MLSTKTLAHSIDMHLKLERDILDQFGLINDKPLINLSEVTLDEASSILFFMGKALDKETCIKKDGYVVFETNTQYVLLKA